MTELVDACHGAENVFDLLRQGVRTVNSELMDVILQALDTINEMFATIKNRDQPEPADPELLAVLHKLGQPPTAEELAGDAVVEEDTASVETPSVEPEAAVEQLAMILKKTHSHLMNYLAAQIVVAQTLRLMK